MLNCSKYTRRLRALGNQVLGRTFGYEKGGEKRGKRKIA
jgi:hypothetical protein